MGKTSQLWLTATTEPSAAIDWPQPTSGLPEERPRSGVVGEHRAVRLLVSRNSLPPAMAAAVPTLVLPVDADHTFWPVDDVEGPHDRRRVEYLGRQDVEPCRPARGSRRVMPWSPVSTIVLANVSLAHVALGDRGLGRVEAGVGGAAAHLGPLGGCRRRRRPAAAVVEASAAVPRRVTGERGEAGEAGRSAATAARAPEVCMMFRSRSAPPAAGRPPTAGQREGTTRLPRKARVPLGTSTAAVTQPR